jgi:hypothetical protein
LGKLCLVWVLGKQARRYEAGLKILIDGLTKVATYVCMDLTHYIVFLKYLFVVGCFQHNYLKNASMHVKTLTEGFNTTLVFRMIRIKSQSLTAYQQWYFVKPEKMYCCFLFLKIKQIIFQIQKKSFQRLTLPMSFEQGVVQLSTHIFPYNIVTLSTVLEYNFAPTPLYLKVCINFSTTGKWHKYLQFNMLN